MKAVKGQRGFIFSLDATLAMLVMLIVMAGVVRVSGPGLTSRQQGYLRIERYANDALEVMQNSGSLDLILSFVKSGHVESAKNVARAELMKILPTGVQFKLTVGGDRLKVYPDDVESWEDVFSNVEELAVASRMLIMSPENFRVLAFLDDANDNAFMDMVEYDMGWTVTRTDNEDFLRSEAVKLDASGNYYYKTVFIPDADRGFSGATESVLVNFSRNIGRLVVGGDTLWNDSRRDSAWEFWEVLGVDYNYIARPPLNALNTGMRIEDDASPITTSPYYIGYRVAYAGASNFIYVYHAPISFSVGHTSTLADWMDVPSGGIGGLPWPGIIFRDSIGGEIGTGVLFNMCLAQSAAGDGIGIDDWVTFARRAICWVGEWKFEHVTLYLWRGAPAG